MIKIKQTCYCYNCSTYTTTINHSHHIFQVVCPQKKLVSTLLDIASPHRIPHIAWEFACSPQTTDGKFESYIIAPFVKRIRG